MTAERHIEPSVAGATSPGYIRARQLYGIMRLDRFTQPANIAAAAMVCFIAWGQIPTSVLMAWTLAISGMAILRMLMAWDFSRHGPPTTASRGAVWQIIWHTVATSILYSGMLIYLVPIVGPSGHLVIVAVITGLIAAGALALATLPAAVVIWVTILAIGSYAAMALNPTTPQTWQLAAFLGLYAVIVVICSVFTSRIFMTSEIAATAARARLVDAIESLSDAFLLWDRERRPLLTNTAAEGMVDQLKGLGLPGATLTGDPPGEGARAASPLELRIPDGRWLAVRERTTHEGGIVAICSDITERKRTEETVSRAASRYQSLMQTASEGIHVVDEDGNLIEASASFLRELGYPESPLPRLSVADWDARVKREDVPRVIRNRMSMPPGIFETQHRRADGTLYDAEVSAHMVLFEGRRYLYCSVRNVTERKRALEERAELERQLQQSLKMEAVGQLTGGVAHDFNNLLAVLLGHLQLIEEEAQDADAVREWTRACIKVVDRGATLTRSLLAFSRQQSLMPVEIDLNAVVGEMTEIMKRTLGETIEIRAETAAGLWHCEADPGQLQNALLNLALNARDAMPDGGKLYVETGNARIDADYAARHNGVKPGDFVMLAVSDTGTGMPPEVLNRVFEPFFTTKDTGKGSGLGLSMVYGFVNQSGGHINVYSEVGRGTTVRIYLPRKLDARTAGAEPKMDRVLRPGHETILLVEDNDDLRAVTQLQLRRLGYTVLGAANAAEGLAQLERHAETHLLLTDIVLPGGVDGIRLAERAKAVRPALEVVFMTGYTEHGALQDLAAAHPGRLLHKPFHSDDLAALIRAVLDRR